MMDAVPAVYDVVSPGGRPVRVDASRGWELTAYGQPCYPWTGAYACAANVNGRWFIYAVRGKLDPKLLAHELEHVDGLPADHVRTK